MMSTNDEKGKDYISWNGIKFQITSGKLYLDNRFKDHDWSDFISGLDDGGLETLSTVDKLVMGHSTASLDGIDQYPFPEKIVLIGIRGTFGEIKGLDNFVNLKQLGLTNIKSYVSPVPAKPMSGALARAVAKNPFPRRQEIHVGTARPCLKRIRGLENLSKLEILGLDGCISCIEGLDNLHNLKRLNLSANEISKIEGLDELQELKVLDLSGNKIEQIEGLDNLHGLEYLDLSKNRIATIEGLGGLTNLRSLHLEDNQITSLRGFEQFPHLIKDHEAELIEEDDDYIPLDPLVDGLQVLYSIFLNHNHIGEAAIKEALRDEGLQPFLLHVDLSGNPCPKDVLGSKIAEYVDLIKAIMEDMRDKEESDKYYDKSGGANVYINFADEIVWRSSYGPALGLSTKGFSDCFAGWLANGKAPLAFKYEYEDRKYDDNTIRIQAKAFFREGEGGKKRLTYEEEVWCRWAGEKEWRYEGIKTFHSLWKLV